MDKEKFYRWLDDQIENYEQYFSILKNREKANIFSDGDVFVKNIEFLMQKDKCIQLSGLCEMAPLLGIELIKEPYDHPVAGSNYGGRCYLEYRGYSFFDLYAKENSTDA